MICFIGVVNIIIVSVLMLINLKKFIKNDKKI